MELNVAATVAEPVTAGYSGTPLAKKLGLKTGQRVLFVDAPEGYDETLGDLPGGLDVKRRLVGDFDFLQVFLRRRADLGRRLPAARRRLRSDGMLWISWPKKTSPLWEDLTETDVRRWGLEHGLVDVKVCAVDDDWSGLKFVVPVKDR